MKKYSLVLSLLLLLINNLSKAQAPPIAWQKCLGGPYLDFGQSVEPTSDGGSIVVGYVGGNGGDVSNYHGNIAVNDYWVAKLDSRGAIQWARTLGGTSFDAGAAVRQTPDGGYVVAGQAASRPGDGDVTSPNKGGTDYWMVKLSSTGGILWENSFGGEKNEYCYDLRLTADGGYILAGETESTGGDVTGNHGGRDAWVVKVNGDGSLAWQKCIGGTQDDEAYSIQARADGYIIAGYASSNDGDASGNHGQTDVLVAKLDLSGNLLWSKCLGGSSADAGWGVDNSPDGGYIVAGYTSSADGNVSGNHGGGGWRDAWVVKLDNSGGLQWQRCYGGSYNEGAYSIAATPDGGYVLGGWAESLDGDVTCMPANIPQRGLQAGWVVKITGAGVLQWQKVISGGYYDAERSVRPTADGGYLVAGYTALNALASYHKDQDPHGSVGDFYVAKLKMPVLTINQPPANICTGAPVTLTATVSDYFENSSYQWIRNLVNQMVASPTYTATNFANGDQVYARIIVDDGVCGLMPVSSNTVTLSVSPLLAPTVSITANAASVCSGAPLTFTAAAAGGTPAGVYQWLVDGQPVGANTTTYSSSLGNGDIVSCVYTDNTVCVVPGVIVSNPITARVNPAVAVSVSIAADATTVCAGAPVHFTATPVGGGDAPSYQWLVNGGPVGAGGAGYTSTTPANGDAVSCLLSSSAACSSPTPATSNLVTLTVQPVRTSSVSIGYAPTTICSGKPVVFTSTATDAGASPAYQWQVNGQPVGTGGPSYRSSALADGDVVSCQVSGADCVISSDASVTVQVFPTPVVGTAPPVVLSKGQSTPLDLPVTGSIAVYTWSPATGLFDPAVARPVATPLATTTYTLTVVTAAGCEDSGRITVKVFSKLSIPAAFSPNGDGHNDVFYVIGGPLGSTIGDFAVFDRWGRIVFRVHDVAPDDPAFGWNGMVEGRPALPGTYVYEIRMVLADGQQQVAKGTVILVR